MRKLWVVELKHADRIRAFLNRLGGKIRVRRRVLLSLLVLSQVH
jgi:hypothetical protein